LGNPHTREVLTAEVPLVASDPGNDPRAWRKELERAVAKSPLFRAAFARKVEPAVALSRDIGNIYSGSLYLALASLFDQESARALAGRRIVFGSYGSGASAKVFSGIVADGYDAIARKLHIRDDLRPESDGGTRVALTVAEYERLHALSDCEIDFPEALSRHWIEGAVLGVGDLASLRAAWAKPTWRVRPRGDSVRPPRGEFALDHLGTSVSAQRTDVGYRYYVWAP
jgi:hydroxymethylglutaryl-CoA synthase